MHINVFKPRPQYPILRVPIHYTEIAMCDNLRIVADSRHNPERQPRTSFDGGHSTCVAEHASPLRVDHHHSGLQNPNF